MSQPLPQSCSPNSVTTIGTRAASGTVSLDGTDVSAWHTRRRREAGFGYIPEDRHRQGLLLDAPLWENRMLGHQTEPPNNKGAQPTTRFSTTIPSFANNAELSKLLQNKQVTINAHIAGGVKHERNDVILPKGCGPSMVLYTAIARLN